MSMENAEEVMQILERFSRLKQKEIPKELDDYLQFVAKTGDTVFKWENLKYLFREKLLNVITHFHDTTPRVDEIPQYPNVDPFNYESMKSSLLERLEHFNAAPFTIQRLCELLIDPKKQYNRIDKFMRALEKNILVVSTVEPGRKRTESESGDSLDSVVNGDISLDVNVDIDMDNESLFSMEATQNGNGTVPTSVSPIAATESANDTKTVNNKKPAEESDVVVNVTSTHEPPTGDDEDLQPSPKKAKLDPSVETVTATSTIKSAEKNDEVTVEKVVATEKVGSKEIIEEKKSEGNESAKPEIKAETNGVSEESEKTAAKPETSDEIKKEMETEKKVEIEKEKESATKVVVETKADEIVESSSDINPVPSSTVAIKTTNEIVSSKDKTEVDSSVSKEDAKLDEISSAVEENEQQEAAAKIIEKQEIEKCEKELIPAKVENAGSNEENVPTQSANAENKKTLETKIDGVKNEQDKPKEEEKEQIKESNNEAEVASEGAAATKATSSVAADTSVEASSAVESSADKLITSSTTSANTVEEKKTDDVETSVTTTEDVKSVTPKPDAIETATTITSTSIGEIPPTTEKIEIASGAVMLAKIDKELISDVKTDAAAEPIVIATDTAAIVVSPIAAVVAADPIVPPTLALNDQPMDEDATVDEVVMAESITTTTGDAIEMATDAMEATISVSSDAAKVDELTDGMDVDDTSPQGEAMDQ